MAVEGFQLHTSDRGTRMRAPIKVRQSGLTRPGLKYMYFDRSQVRRFASLYRSSGRRIWKVALVMMKSAHQVFSIICLLTGAGIGSFATPAVAEDTQLPPSLVGIWAHSKEDCQVKLSGQLERDGQGNWQNSDYEFVGFCKNGMELLYQPIFCTAGKVEENGTGYNYSGRCRVKDYPLANLAFKIQASADGGISFNEKEFENSDFSISGHYVRCSLTYKCEGHVDDK